MAFAQRTGASYQLPAGTSLKGFDPVAAGLPAALHRKVTTVARLQEIPGPKWVASTPEVMPFSTAQRTGFSYQLPAGTSTKGLRVLFGSGLPAAFHRKVTTVARLQAAAGPKWVVGSLSHEARDKFAIIVATIVDEIAEDFTTYFAAIDVVDERDYLEELQACIIKISMLLSAVDGDDLDSEDSTKETFRGFAIYTKLFKEKWEKHMQDFLNS